MFTHKETGVIIHADLNSSVSHATLRPADLIPTFLEVLKTAPEYPELFKTLPLSGALDGDHDWYGTEDAAWLLDDLFKTLNQYAPDGFYFGATEGDGANFGYWQTIED